jgi:hypothetical protein
MCMKLRAVMQLFHAVSRVAYVPSDMFITASARRLPSSLFHEVGGAAPLVSNLLSLSPGSLGFGI